MPEDTNSAILRTATALLREHPFDDVSYRSLADQVGVSERTVFRQFPTRAHLLEAVAGWIDEHEFTPIVFADLAGFQSAVRAGFHEFDAEPAFAFLTARAAAMSPTRDAGPSAIARMLEVAVADACPGLNARDETRAVASLRSFASAQFWARMRAAFGLDAAEIGDAFDWSVARTLDALGIQHPAVAPVLGRRA